MRLNRYLAAAGLGSRRGCEELIRTGQVTVNGRVCTDLATQVEEGDAVKASGHLVHPEKPLYVLLNKPPGYLCTAEDTHERRTIFDLIPKNWPRIFHVGRLDKESEGLLILTNDGDLALKLTHPRFKIEKEYEVVIDRPFDPEHRATLLKGIFIEGGCAKAEAVHRLSAKSMRLILRQGLKRQIRLMFYALGYEVKHLGRIRIGPLRLQGLHSGEWRFLTPREVESLKKGSAEKSATAPAKRIRKTPASSSRARPARRRAA